MILSSDTSHDTEHLCESWRARARLPLWQPWIDEVWWSPAHDVARRALILPDNCMDVIFSAGAWRLVGPATQAYFATVNAHRATFGVRFKPGVLALLCELSAQDVLGGVVPVEDVLVGDVAQVLTHRLLALQGDVRLDIIRALDRTDAHTVDALGDELGWSTRHLRRVLPALLGYSARTWLHVRGFQRMRRLLVETNTSCAVVAAHAGYADQAHMNRMCKRFAQGATPQQLRQILRAS
jgi:AraC-like DNA-binding protein